MRLPTAVRAAALAAVGGTRLQKEFAWMSWAGTVWRLEGQNGAPHRQLFERMLQKVTPLSGPDVQ